MRETVRSLRIYLALAGTIGVFANIGQLASQSSPSWITLVVLAGLAASAGLLYLAVRLRQLLRHRMAVALAVIHGNLAYTASMLVLALLIRGGGILVGQIGFGLLVLVYIRSNLLRLGEEEQAAAGPGQTPEGSAA